MMTTPTTLLYFLSASMALTIAPGPDNIFVLTQGIARGRKPAIVTALGMCSGVSVHTVLAAFGISAIFYSSVLAFNIVKFTGVVYLLYLAWCTLKDKGVIHLAVAEEHSLIELYRRGFIMNVLNPKVAMFFLAFLPQFVSPGANHFVLNMFLLGLVFMVQAVVIFCLIGYFSGSIGVYFLKKHMVALFFNYLTAGVFGSLAVRLALTQR